MILLLMILLLMIIFFALGVFSGRGVFYPFFSIDKKCFSFLCLLNCFFKKTVVARCAQPRRVDYALFSTLEEPSTGGIPIAFYSRYNSKPIKALKTKYPSRKPPAKEKRGYVKGGKKGNKKGAISPHYCLIFIINLLIKKYLLYFSVKRPF